MVGIPNGVSPVIDYMQVLEGANVKVTLEKVRFKMGELVTIA